MRQDLNGIVDNLLLITTMTNSVDKELIKDWLLDGKKSDSSDLR